MTAHKHHPINCWYCNNIIKVPLEDPIYDISNRKYLYYGSAKHKCNKLNISYILSKNSDEELLDVEFVNVAWDKYTIMTEVASGECKLVCKGKFITKLNNYFIFSHSIPDILSKTKKYVNFS